MVLTNTTSGPVVRVLRAWTWRTIGAPLDRLVVKTGGPSIAEKLKHRSKWNFLNSNDRIIWEREPKKDRLEEAFALREKNPEAGFALLLELAEEGSTWAMIHVGWAYSNGLGVTVDTSKAEVWYRRAFECGSQSALLNYLHYLWPRGEVELREDALNRGVAINWAPAIYWLAVSRIQRSQSRRTLQEARPLLERAAELGSPQARQLLASEMSLGRYGLREVPRGIRMMWEFTIAEINDWDAETREWKVAGPTDKVG
jgi:TPR repeat protein